jgi:hypothetical protein
VIIFIGAVCFSDRVPDVFVVLKVSFIFVFFNSFVTALIYFRKYANVAHFYFYSLLLSCVFVLFDYILLLSTMFIMVFNSLQGDYKLLSGFSWPVTFEPKLTK